MQPLTSKPYNDLLLRTEKYALQVRKLFGASANSILSQIPTSLLKLNDDELFSFNDNKKLQEMIQAELRRLHAAVYTAIRNGVQMEWETANTLADELLTNNFTKEALQSPYFRGMLARNTDAMEAFLQRKENGLDLSERVWKTTEQLRDEMELSLSVSIGEGESASTISRRVRQYLNEPDKLFRRVRGEDGKLHLSKAAQAYHPGQGVYRSSAKNAMRLARTETNIAYRRADNERWQQMTFVLGQEINLSRSHPKPDICDTLAGRYPKDFLFDGWHPQCFCYAVPILASKEDFAKMQKAALEDKEYDLSDKQVRDVPDNFKSWLGENQERIANAQNLPYFLRNNGSFDDDGIFVLKEFMPLAEPKEMTLKQIADLRHANRTEAEIADIKQRWAERRHKHEVIRKAANNVLKVAQDYGEVDYSALQDIINANNLNRMQEATRALAQQILAMRKEEQALSALIPNVHTLHQSYSLNELKLAYGELDGVMTKWMSKYSYSSLDNAPLLHLKNKLDFELSSPTIRYSYKEIIEKAIKEKIRIIDEKIEWENLVQKANSLKSFKTRSLVFKDCISKIDIAIQNNDFNALKQSIAEAEIQQQKIIDKQIKRSGTTALNKEYKGGAVGQDLTATIDVRNMQSEDPFDTYGHTYTNNIARLQGFDSPAKLVTEQEFDMLMQNCGDVFYRTLNPAKVNGIQMTGEEFASLMYKADKLEMNGPGGRVYGDGFYVATSAWNGSKLAPLSQINKNDAFSSSRAYGRRGQCATLEMTWTRNPKIIEQGQLKQLWNNLTPEQKRKIQGNIHDDEIVLTTFGCALGYDAMYCSNTNYMVIWNRSIIAVKNKTI